MKLTGTVSIRLHIEDIEQVMFLKARGISQADIFRRGIIEFLEEEKNKNEGVDRLEQIV